jgi:hypothetical protein
MCGVSSSKESVDNGWRVRWGRCCPDGQHKKNETRQLPGATLFRSTSPRNVAVSKRKILATYCRFLHLIFIEPLILIWKKNKNKNKKKAFRKWL